MTFAMKIQEERKEGLKEGILKAITMLKNLKLDKETAIKQIASTYSLTNKEATALVNSNW